METWVYKNIGEVVEESCLHEYFKSSHLQPLITEERFLNKLLRENQDSHLQLLKKGYENRNFHMFRPDLGDFKHYLALWVEYAKYNGDKKINNTEIYSGFICPIESRRPGVLLR